MKEMVMARADLKAAGEGIRKSKPQVRNDQKDKVGQHVGAHSKRS
jgi:hypothetical protein